MASSSEIPKNEKSQAESGQRAMILSQAII